MNSLKSVFILAVLAAVAYGVYVTITRNPELSKGPATTAPGWPEAKLQIPGPGAVTPEFPDASSGPVAMAGGGPAPQFAPGAIAAPGGASAGVVSPLPQVYPQGRRSIGVPPAPSGIGGVGASPARDRVESIAPMGASPVAGDPQSSPADGDNLVLRSDALPSPARTVIQSSADGAPQAGFHSKFAAFMQVVQKKLDKGRLAEAHLALSSLYGNPDLPVEHAQQVTNLLDQLAGTIIYSRQHLLEAPYKVKPGDTIEQIAETHNVPWQLLANINGIRDPQQVRSGQEFKVVRGPFNAQIELNRHELTLMLNGCYAGRFGIGVGLDHANLEGSYVVCSRVVNPQYYGPDGVQINADDPNNPYGGFWIGLAEQIGQQSRTGIHGTNDPRSLHQTGGRGSIRLGDQDIKDLFGILSVGSKVVIR